MPFELSCKECGTVMFTVKGLGETTRFLLLSDWYPRQYMRLHGHCPNCGRCLPKPEDYAREMKLDVSVIVKGQLVRVEAPY